MAKLTPSLVRAMSVMAKNFALYYSRGNGWRLTDGSKVAGTTASVLLSRGWAGDQTMGFYRITAAGRAALAQEDETT
jgi:hypothetical protein